MAQMMSAQMMSAQMMSAHSCPTKNCSNKCCVDKKDFIKPKSYSELLKENQDLSAKNQELSFLKYDKTIKSLQELNMTLIQKIKEMQEEETKIKEECRLAQEESRSAQDQCRLAQEQKQVFIRTYTNMSIEMLKLEDKLAKFEGRHF
jgi:hypothetical protein